MAKYVFNPFTGKLDTSIDEATITNNITAASGGYEFTAGFADRSTGNTGLAHGLWYEFCVFTNPKSGLGGYSEPNTTEYDLDGIE
jgi:hypothetical protein